MSHSAKITTDVEYVADVLNRGGVAGIPTETVYGLGARADLENSVHRIFDIKGRPRNHPLIAHVGDSVDFRQWAHFNSAAEKLAEHFWPGPLTLLLPKTHRVGLWVTGGRNTVALRMPRHDLTLRLLSLVNDPVVAPSANRFGKVSPTTAHHVANDLGNDVDCILDGGPCEYGLESTIIECNEENITVLRPGAITVQDISEFLDMSVSLDEGESRAPGMLLSHYAPNAEIRLVQTPEEAESVQNDLHSRDISSRILWFEDASQYATHLYDFLRQCDFNETSVVVAVLPSDFGIGTAIRDRLYKAAAAR